MSSRQWIAVGVSAAVLAVGVPAGADLPDAGTRVVNQANVLYSDENGEAREALTNQVVLFIQQVFAATLEGDQQRPLASGDTARFVHTLTNTGNGADTFCVAGRNLTGDGSDFERIDIVLDADGDGIATENEQILHSSAGGSGVPGLLTLDAGESADQILMARTADDEAAGTVLDAELSVSAQGGTGGCGAVPVADIGSNADSADGTNRDRVTISNDAILEITKASVYDPGLTADLSDDTIYYVITVTNSGASPATDLTVTDTLVPALDFGAFGTHSGTFSSGPANLANVVTAEADSLSPGDSLIIRFSATVADTLGNAGESRDIDNFATVQADLDGGGLDPVLQSNTTRDRAPDVFSVQLQDTGAGAADGVNDGGDDDGATNDDQRVNAAAPGDTVFFELRATNEGNALDTYNLEVAGTLGWLASSSYKFLYTDRRTPLLDTNGDGVPDTGPLRPGEAFNFIVAAVLPFGEDSAPHSSVVTARSTADVSGGVIRPSDTTGISIGSSLSARVDLSNSASASGFNDDGSTDAHPVSTIASEASIAPGEDTVFDLFVANEGAGSDVFSLAIWADAAGTAALPAGWTAVLLGLDGQPVSSTPALSPGETFAFRARVTAPDTALDGERQSIFIRVESFETGAADVKQDAVSIVGLPHITLEPDRREQISPCGVATYLHTLQNTGQTTEDIQVSIASQSHLVGDIRFASEIEASEPAGFLPFDFATAGDDVAVFGANGWRIDPLVAAVAGPAIRLAPGEKAALQLRVLAACETPLGTRDLVTLRAISTDNDAVAEARDTTIVSNARVQLVKLGAPDTACDGNADTGFNDDQVIAGPGECVIWQIMLSNTGAETVCNVSAHDAAPAFTALSGSPLIVSQPAPGEGVCSVQGATFSCSLGNTLNPGGPAGIQPHCLASGETAEVRFGVRVE